MNDDDNDDDDNDENTGNNDKKEKSSENTNSKNNRITVESNDNDTNLKSSFSSSVSSSSLSSSDYRGLEESCRKVILNSNPNPNLNPNLEALFMHQKLQNQINKGMVSSAQRLSGSFFQTTGSANNHCSQVTQTLT
jgi:hypothetical protein